MQELTISEILNNKDLIYIPTVQRGHVWKNYQIELLWDSLMRGFPIGAFIVKSVDGKLALIDGQQRYDAILSANKSSSNCNTLLWFDFGKMKEGCSSRKYNLRVNTRYQPWGYHLADFQSNADTETKRIAAVKLFDDESKINVYSYMDDLNLEKETWPCIDVDETSFTVPFWCVAVLSKDPEEYVDKVLDNIKEFKDNALAWKRNFPKQVTREMIREIHPAIQIALSAKIYLIEYEGNLDDRDMEIFFSRVAKGGTVISNNDLYYSTIKVIMQDTSYRDCIEQLADDLHIPANIFGICISKYILSYEIKTEYSEMFNVDTFRVVASHESFRKNAVSFLTELQKSNTINQLNKMMVYDGAENIDGMPSYLLYNQIFTKWPDLICLSLILFGDEEYTVKKGCIYRSLIFRLYFSCLADSKSSVVIRNIISAYIKLKNVNDILDIIDNELRKAIYKEQLVEFIPPMDLKPDCGLYNLLSNFSQFEKSFLLYAERDFIQKEYKNISVIIEGECRPWDYDHIIPKSLLESKMEDDFSKKYISSLGNLAAIPFAVNRSKNDSIEFDYYEKYRNDLYFMDDFKSLDKSDFNIDEFINVISRRCINIYTSVYEGILKENILFNTSGIDSRNDALSKYDRKSFFSARLFYLENIIKTDENALFDIYDQCVEKDCLKSRLSEYDKCRAYIGIVFDYVDNCDIFPSIIIFPFKNSLRIEVGLRIVKHRNDDGRHSEYRSHVADNIESLKNDVLDKGNGYFWIARNIYSWKGRTEAIKRLDEYKRVFRTFEIPGSNL